MTDWTEKLIYCEICGKETLHNCFYEYRPGRMREKITIESCLECQK